MRLAVLALAVGCLGGGPAFAEGPKASAEAAANKEIPLRSTNQSRYFVDLQLGLGANTQDDLEFATSWSVGGGLRFLPHTFAMARMRHSSPFRDSLVEDIAIALITDTDPAVYPADGRARTHQSDLTLGLNLQLGRLGLEAGFGGVLVYQVDRGDYDDRASWIATGAVAYQLTPPMTRKVEEFSMSFAAAASVDPFAGDLLRIHLGLVATGHLF